MIRKVCLTAALAIGIALGAHATAWANSFNIRPAVPGPVGSPSLQSVFDNIGSSLSAATNQDAAALFEPTSIGGAMNSLFFENPSASYRFTNTFGIYSAADPTKKLQIFAGAEGPFTPHTVEFAKGGAFDGVELDNNPLTLINGFGFTFGFYMVNGVGATFYSEDSRNPSGAAQALIYQGNGDQVDLFEANDHILGCQGNPVQCLTDAGAWYVAFEDLSGAVSDHNYSDMVVQVQSIQAVPEPGSMALFGTGLLGVAGAARRRLKK